jgi:hypothetical protein
MSRSCRLPVAAGATPRAPIVSESAVVGRPFGLPTNRSSECSSDVNAVGELV